MIVKLLAINFKSILSGMASRTSGAKSALKKKALIGFVMVSVVLSLFSMFFIFFETLCQPYFEAGLGWLYFAMLALTEFAICVITTVFSVSSVIFNAKDNELLTSMPIKPPAILISRLLTILLMEYAFAIVVALGAFVPWALNGYITLAGCVYLIIGVALVPLMALAVSMLLAWLLGTISSKIRFFKNATTLLLSIVFLGVYFYVYANMQKYLNEMLLRGEEMAEAFRKAMPPFYVFGKAIAEANFISFFQMVCWSVLSFGAAVVLLSLNYNKVLTTNRGTVKVAYKEKTENQKTPLAAFVRKELAHYASRPMVILNTSMASILMVIAAGALLIYGTETLVSIAEVLSLFGMENMSLSVLCAAALTMLCAMNNLSSSLISLEGRHLWIAKSTPVPAKTVLISKMCAHWFTTAVPCLLASLCATIVTAQSVLDVLILFIMPQTFIVFTAVSGLAINLHFPKLDWTNEALVVKQGASALIAMFGTMGAVTALAVLYGFALKSFIVFTTFLWLCALIFVLLSCAIYLWIMSGGVKRYESL